MWTGTGDLTLIRETWDVSVIPTDEDSSNLHPSQLGSEPPPVRKVISVRKS